MACETTGTIFLYNRDISAGFIKNICILEMGIVKKILIKSLKRVFLSNLGCKIIKNPPFLGGTSEVTQCIGVPPLGKNFPPKKPGWW